MRCVFQYKGDRLQTRPININHRDPLPWFDPSTNKSRCSAVALSNRPPSQTTRLDYIHAQLAQSHCFYWSELSLIT